VIGGDPCQSHSALANFVRAKGLEPSFPDLTTEFVRVVEEARPRWFLRENVPGAPDAKPAGYDMRSFLLDHSTLDRGDGTGHEQMRRRRFWVGTRDVACPELRQFIDFALFVLPEPALTVNTAHDHLDGAERIAARRYKATARDASAIGITGGHAGNARRYSLAEMLHLQGLPADLFDHSPFTMQGKRKLIGNAVPLPMARALAKAVRRALEREEAETEAEALEPGLVGFNRS
jgi:DNA (cytosine-5)-methyltransferase 1